MTQQELEALLNVWVKRLRLRDWEIEVTLASYPEINPDGRLGGGDIEYDDNFKRAAIRILAPGEYYPPNAIVSRDPERTLVHELLHIHLAARDAGNDNLAFQAQEQAINMITDALVRLAREGKG